MKLPGLESALRERMSRMPEQNSRLVYSTDGGRVRETPAKAVPRKAAPAQPRLADPDDGVVRVRREKKQRGGKVVTTVTGLPGSPADLDALLKVLKQHCGAGGAREERTLVIQGDHRDRLVARLESLGHRPKLAGG